MKECPLPAPYLPVLHIAQRGRGVVSRIALPFHLCAAHRGNFLGRLMGEESRSQIEEALRSRGRAPPDWSRTTVEFTCPE